MKKTIKLLFRKKAEHRREGSVEAEYITHVADEDVINVLSEVDYVEGNERNADKEDLVKGEEADEEKTEAAKEEEEADELDEEVKMESEARGGESAYVVVCDDEVNDANTVDYIKDRDDCNDVVDNNSDDNNNNANNDISGTTTSNNNNGNSVSGVGGGGGSSSSSSSSSSSNIGSHNYTRNFDYPYDVEYVNYHMNAIIKNCYNDTMDEFCIRDDNEFLKEACILVLLILLFIPLCIYYFYSLVNYVLF
ncbi:hypothetical protein MN116_000124 [Schistosoma mekongi]|uniref:Uncharacterized protein n=1 Tax=Schistosoma mekongi TaxID=38744 RepID=A0AAE1ZIM2_SCHME|nr:hypothetical protein MN116_000124 [Schistosoma mekongi]